MTDELRLRVTLNAGQFHVPGATTVEVVNIYNEVVGRLPVTFVGIIADCDPTKGAARLGLETYRFDVHTADA